MACTGTGCNGMSRVQLQDSRERPKASASRVYCRLLRRNKLYFVLWSFPATSAREGSVTSGLFGPVRQ
jgi:hypothetical protein